MVCGWNDFSANSCSICITEPCQHTVSIWKEMQHNWLFFMFAELYEGAAKIIPNILDSFIINYLVQLLVHIIEE